MYKLQFVYLCNSRTLLPQVLPMSSYCCWAHCSQPAGVQLNSPTMELPLHPLLNPIQPLFSDCSPICDNNCKFKASSQIDMQLHPVSFRYLMSSSHSFTHIINGKY